jgi:predicted Zn-dependent protease
MKKNLCALLAVVYLVVLSAMELSAASRVNSQQGLAQEDTVKAALAKAQSLAKQGNAEEASKIYTGIMKTHPNNKEAVQGWLMTNMKRSPTGEEEAIKQLEDLQKLYPDNTAILFFMMYLEAEHGHNEEALRDCEILIQKQPDDPLNYVGKGQVLTELKRYQEAYEAFDKATSLDPKRFDVWSMKAGVLSKLGRFDDAIAASNKAMELAPGRPVNYYNRACYYCLKGEKENALADLKKAIELNPKFKKSARLDEDFKSLYEDADFRKLTQE